MSVPLQTVPDDHENDRGSSEDPTATQARHEAAEIIAGARRQAEAIVAEARMAKQDPSSPLAALGDNAEEIIGQVRKLIKKQRQLEAEQQELTNERDEMATQIEVLKTERDDLAAQIEPLRAERDELVQRLTDAVIRMEELAALAGTAEATSPQPPAAPFPPQASGHAHRADPVDNGARSRPSFAAAVEKGDHTGEPSIARPFERAEKEDTSLAARLQRAEQEDDTSLAARLRQAGNAEPAAGADESARSPEPIDTDGNGIRPPFVVDSEGRSFYSRHSAKLPRLEGDGGRSVLSAVGGMRPETEPKGRKGRRRKKDK